MAIFKALTFDGVNSLDYGIYITGEAVYNAPERAVEMVNIPGKNGALALDQGRFENIEVTYHAGCFADNQADFADKVMKFRNALASRYTYKRLTDEYHPDEYRLGLYKSGLDVDAVRYGTAGEFDIVFDCKPQRFLVDGDRAISPTEWSDVQTESGELVTIDSDGSLAVRSLEVELEPIQDLNGYDAPWVGGAGKNKLPYFANSMTEHGLKLTPLADGTVKVNGTATATTTFFQTGYVDTWPSGSYVLSGCPSGGDLNTYALRIYRTGGNTLATDTGNGTSFTGQSGLAVAIVVWSGTTLNNAIFKPMIRLESETDATYEPYSNICPISGHTEVDVTRTGKNLLPYPYYNSTKTSNGITWTVNEDGTVTANGTATAESQFLLTTRLNGNDWTGKKFSCMTVESGNPWQAKGAVQLYGAPWTTLAGDYGRGATVPNTASGVGIRFILAVASGVTVDNLVFKPMIRLASETDSTYEPYQGTTYTTALGRTVYGATLDVVSGVLTVDRAMVDLGTLNWAYNSGGNGYFTSDGIYSSVKRPSGYGSLCGLLSSNYEEKTTNQIYSGETGVGIRGSNGLIWVHDATISTTDPAVFKTAMSGVQLCYLLATPQTYQLTPQQIDLLLGTNHLWSDGEITVEYGVHPYYNPTPFASKPLIKVTGRGTLGIGEYILTITGTASQTLYIDCETMEIYTIEGTVPTGASSLVSINKNDFPVLEPGTNYISVGSGITAVTITPRWWRI